MSGISGKVREQKESQDSVKKVGLFEAKVIVINPDFEQFKNILGIELNEDSKSTEYLGESRDGNTSLRVSVWLEDVKTEQKFNLNFFLEDKERVNKEGSKNQYINQLGMCTWADHEDSLAQWFKGTSENPKDYRVSYVGEEELYEFLRAWLCKLDYSSPGTELSIDWKKMMRGNLKELTSQIDGEFCDTFVAMATVATKEKNGEFKEFQSVYNKAFLPSYALKQFRLPNNNYNDSAKIEYLLANKPKSLRPHERFVLKVAGEYGCKDYFQFSDLQDYNPDMNIVATDKVIDDENGDY